MRAREMESKLIQVTRKNYLKANIEIVERLLEQLGIPLSKEAIAQGLKAEQPCRLEKVPIEKLVSICEKKESLPEVYLDVCHNPQAVECVIKQLAKIHPMSRVHVVCGFSKAKDMTSMLHFLATSPNVKTIYPVTSQHFKLQHIDNVKSKVDEIIKLLHPYIDLSQNPFQEPIECGNIGCTLDKVTKAAGENKDVVLVCGSFYIMQDVREFYNFGDETDPKEVNLD